MVFTAVMNNRWTAKEKKIKCLYRLETGFHGNTNEWTWVNYDTDLLFAPETLLSLNEDVSKLHSLISTSCWKASQLSPTCNILKEQIPYEDNGRLIIAAKDASWSSSWQSNESCVGGDQTLTLLRHPRGEAPLQPTVLTSVPGDLVDDAVSVPVTRVHHVFLHAAAEEALRRHAAEEAGRRRC